MYAPCINVIKVHIATVCRQNLYVWADEVASCLLVPGG